MKRWIQIIVATGTIFALTTSSFAAALFTDVSTSHWAYESIKTVSEKEIMPDYGDTAFKPLEKTSKIEAVVIAYRILKATNNLGSFAPATSITNNKAQLSAAGIPAFLSPYGSDVYSAFGFMLDNKLMTKEELSSYVTAGKPVDATKEQVAIIFGKALNYAKKEDLTGKIISFGFADNSDIATAAAPYINLMVEYNLINPDGDANSRLNPKAVLTRETTGYLAAGIYKALSTGTTTGTATTGTTTTAPTGTGTTTGTTTTGTTSTNTSTTKDYGNATVSGTITEIYKEKLSIQVKDSLGQTSTFALSGTEIIKNNAPLGFLNLIVGDNLILDITNGKVTKVIVEKNYSKVSGTFLKTSTKEVSDASTGKKYRVLEITKNDGKIGYYKIETGLYVEIDRVIKQVENLTKGDVITISYDGYFARKIEAYTAKSEVMITVTKVTDFKAGSVLSYKLPDGRMYDLQLKAAPQVVKMGGKEIKKGDIVKGTFVYGALTKVEATGMVAEDSGFIKEIIISDTTSKITILNKDSERKTYSFQSKVIMNVNEEKFASEGIYKLRVGQDVKLSMDALGISQLTLTKVYDQTKITMTLMEVVKGNLLKATDAEGKVWVVNLKDETSYNLSQFNPGDKIEFTGAKLSELIFEATALAKVN